MVYVVLYTLKMHQYPDSLTFSDFSCDTSAYRPSV